jgi:hypothetical protein
MSGLSRSAWLAAIVTLVGRSTSPQELPKAPKAEVISVTPKPGFFTEPSIAINPNNPEQVVAAFQDNAHITYSVDAGQHWQLAAGIEPQNYRVSGDVSVTYDNEGRAFVCYIAFDKLGTFNYWGHNSSRNGIYVRRSLDGGATWDSRDVAATEQPDESAAPWEDKPYIIADAGRGLYAGNLYIGWTRWTLADSELLFVRSTDHGKTWSRPIEIDNTRGLPATTMAPSKASPVPSRQMALFTRYGPTGVTSFSPAPTTVASPFLVRETSSIPPRRCSRFRPLRVRMALRKSASIREAVRKAVVCL